MGKRAVDHPFGHPLRERPAPFGLWEGRREGAFGRGRGLFAGKGPLGWTGTPERGVFGTLRATSVLVQVASFPPVCSALKKFSALKNYITKNLRRLKKRGPNLLLAPNRWEGTPATCGLWRGVPKAKPVERAFSA